MRVVEAENKKSILDKLTYDELAFAKEIINVTVGTIHEKIESTVELLGARGVSVKAQDRLLALANSESVEKKKGARFPYEQTMVLRLLKEWARATRKVTRKIDQFIAATSGDVIGPGDIKALLTEFDDILGEQFGAIVEDDVRSLIDKSYTKGKRHILGPKMLPIVAGIDTEAISWLQKNHTYWINTFYDKKLSGGISDIIADGMGQGLGRADVGAMLKEAFDGYKGLGLQPDSYWRGLAANGMNRSRNFGEIQGFVEAEIKQLVFVAVMDERTSPQCAEMNGKTINTAAAVKQRDLLMAASNPEDVKAIAPWRSAEAIASMDPDDVGMPPLHFHCRSIVVEK